MGEKKAYTCPNEACKRTFTTPLKTLNLQEHSGEPYYACPVCLSKIEAPELAKPEGTSNQLMAPQPVEVSAKHSSKINDKPAECQYHLGYLSMRGQKEIPENCLVCREIVSCMLNRMHIEQ